MSIGFFSMSTFGTSLTGMSGWNKSELNTVLFTFVLQPPKSLSLYPNREKFSNFFIDSFGLFCFLLNIFDIFNKNYFVRREINFVDLLSKIVISFFECSIISFGFSLLSVDLICVVFIV